VADIWMKRKHGVFANPDSRAKGPRATARCRSPGGTDQHNLADGWYTYLVDPTTGESWLTSKRIDPVSTRRRS